MGTLSSSSTVMVAFNSFVAEVPIIYHILIGSEWIGFYVIETSVKKELKENITSNENSHRAPC